MKKTFLLLALLISSPCFSEPMTFKERWTEAQKNIFFNGWHDEIKTYYMHKDFGSALRIIDEITSDKNPKGKYDDWDDDIRHIINGFIAGIIEDNFDKFNSKEKREKLLNLYPENSKIWDVFFPAAWLVFGDGAVKEEKLIKHKITKQNLFHIKGYMLLYYTGYYYATGNPEVIKLMQTLTHKNQSSLCFRPDSEYKKFYECPNDSDLKFFKEMLEFEFISEEEKKEYQNKIQKAQSEECQKYRKEGPCSNRISTYIMAEFLKRNDTKWYNENVKDWFVQKETIIYEKEDIEELKEIEKFRQEEQKYQEQLKKEDNGLTEKNQGINVIFFDAKTGQLKSFDEYLDGASSNKN